MKHLFIFFLVNVFTSTFLLAQDEGRIIKVDRLDKNMGVYFGLGPSFTLGKNMGDYTVGFNVEAGFLKRSNRVFSWGPSFSISGFAYDPASTQDIYIGQNGYGYDGYVIRLEGGDLFLTSLAFTFKLNAAPVKDDSKFSFYVFAKPFITAAIRDDVFGTSDYYTSPDGDPNGSNWTYQNSDEWGPEGFPALAGQTEVTGGIFIGPGIELFPAKRVTIFAQASFGYTMPITFVSTEAWDNSLDSYFDEEFPMVTKGFPSVNIQLGVSFNF